MGSVRVDTTPLIAGACVVSAYAGHGIRGADVPSSGAHGPAILYLGLVLPAEADDEFRALILTRPAGLTLLNIGEDSGLEAEGPDGVYVGTWRGYKNGVVYGPDPSTYTITIGGSGSVSGNAALDGLGASGALGGGTPSALAGGATLDGLGASGVLSAGVPSDLAGGATLDGLQAAGSMGLQAPADLSGSAMLDGLAASGEMGTAVGWQAALNIYTLLAPFDQIDNLGGFAPKASDGKVTLCFDFRRYTAAPLSASVTVTRHRGAADPAPQNVKLGVHGILGSKVFQRVQGGVDYCDYKVRAVVTAADESVYTMEGILPVRPG